MHQLEDMFLIEMPLIFLAIIVCNSFVLFFICAVL